MIQIRNISKDYDGFTAVRSLDFTIEAGTFFGLLGPNGAGKTTTLKMMTMLLNPSEGKISIDGRVLSRKDKTIKKNIGVVTQHMSLQREMTVNETLWHHGMLHRMKKTEIRSRMDELIAFAGMDRFRNRTVQTLSGGNKRKLMIIRSMMHSPKVIFLDEPTVGLDASIRRDIWDLLKALKTEGLTIVMTTHYIEEASQLCDEIGMMREGVLLKTASPDAYMEEIKPYVLEVFDGARTHYHYFETRTAAADQGKLMDGTLTVRQTNLEDVYVKYTNERLSDDIA